MAVKRFPTGRDGTRNRSLGQLASEYGFTDIDGSQPDVWRFIEEIRERDLDANHDEYR